MENRDYGDGTKKILEGNMLEEKLLKKIKTINENFINLGFDLEEDLIELVTQREDIKDRIENTKYKKMTFSKDEEANSYILNLEDCQISFDIIEGEDKQERDVLGAHPTIPRGRQIGRASCRERV